MPNSVQILRPLVAAIDGLRDLVTQLPSVEACRPASCPACGRPARDPGGELGIVGHGVYSRQVLGVDPGGVDVEVPVRRFLCRRCERTTSVLPDLLLPRRWYAAGVILEALRLFLVSALTAIAVRRTLDLPVERETSWLGWRSLRRWKREVLRRLWPGFARRLGARGPARDDAQARERVVRLLREGDVRADAVRAGFAAIPVLASHARAGALAM